MVPVSLKNCGKAAILDTKDLRRALNHSKQQVDDARVLDDIETRQSRRRMSLHTTFDGMWRHDGLYDLSRGTPSDSADGLENPKLSHVAFVGCTVRGRERHNAVGRV